MHKTLPDVHKVEKSLGLREIYAKMDIGHGQGHAQGQGIQLPS
jgi:hypothetical protein